jgi:hypothetical protein
MQLGCATGDDALLPGSWQWHHMGELTQCRRHLRAQLLGTDEGRKGDVRIQQYELGMCNSVAIERCVSSIKIFRSHSTNSTNSCAP